jgi:hypothetical protein
MTTGTTPLTTTDFTTSQKVDVDKTLLEGETKDKKEGKEERRGRGRRRGRSRRRRRRRRMSELGAASNLAALAIPNNPGVTRLVKTGKWKVSYSYKRNSKHLARPI